MRTSETATDRKAIPDALGLAAEIGGVSLGGATDQDGRIGQWGILFDDRTVATGRLVSVVVFAGLEADGEVDGRSTVEVIDVLPVSVSSDEEFSWNTTGCWIGDKYDENIIATLQLPSASQQPTGSWHATAAWRLTREGIVDLDPSEVWCEPST